MLHNFQLEITLPIHLSSDQWLRVTEQLLLLVLIVGRWLLPKGELSHDQLSQLLLVYLGTAADIVEFFEAFKEQQVTRVTSELSCPSYSNCRRFINMLTAGRFQHQSHQVCPVASGDVQLAVVSHDSGDLDVVTAAVCHCSNSYEI